MLQFFIHSDISESPKDDELYIQSEDFNVLKIIKKCELRCSGENLRDGELEESVLVTEIFFVTRLDGK